MSELKKHNSIIFLTTLSVYLGLVLVGGASSPILAQAALTRNFDIQEEIEYKDDLDKKPDDADSNSEKIQDVIDSDFIKSSVLAVLNDLNKLKQIEKYDGSQRFEIEFLFRYAENSNTHSIEKILGGGNIWLFTACEEPAYLIGHLFDKLNPSNFYVYDGLLDKKATNTSVKFLSEKGDLNLQISSKQKSDNEAQKLAKFFNDVFAIASSDTDLKNYEKLIYQHTKAISENDQVFIITNLPRASIDSLFANKDANQAASEK